jgi:pimeloyl-ACP methyl ester carboxylesterase
MRAKWKLLASGWLLVLAGGGLARAIQTAGGVDVRDVRFDSQDGTRMSALLYVPRGVTTEAPAPGVLAVHGYINSRETQSGFAIELARRGYVVLAIDQTGHGFSGGRAMSAGYGGPAGLAYLRGLPFVDKDNIGLEGHSMGGWAVVTAAAAEPDGYRSLVLVGSSTGPGVAPAGSPTFPRNLGVVFSKYDEFAPLMWGVAEGAEVTSSRKLKGVFGVEEDVAPGKVYGSIEAGTARWLATPTTTHPGDHLSTAAIGDAVHWLDMTLDGERSLPDSDQIWPWKEAGTALALIGGVVVLLGTLELLLSLPRFAGLLERSVGPAERPSGRWWLTALWTTAIPALTYFEVTTWGARFSASRVFPQAVTNQILVWALANGVLALPVLLIGRKRREGRLAAKALAGILSVASVYVAVLVSQWIFKSDFRLWVVALKPMALHHVPAFLAYVIPFTAFFYVTQRAYQATLPLKGAGPAGDYATALAATAGGFTLMMASLYATLLSVGHLPSFAGIGALFTIVGIQFVPVLAACAVVSVFAWRRTNGPLVGSIMCGVLVTWYIVAGQATQA